MQSAYYITGVFSHDAYMVSLLLHICGQLDVLARKFQKLEHESKVLARRFHKLKDRVKTFEEKFMVLFLIQFTAGGLILCAVGKSCVTL